MQPLKIPNGYLPTKKQLKELIPQPFLLASIVALNFRKSTQNLFKPSGLGININGAAQGLDDGRMIFA